MKSTFLRTEYLKTSLLLLGFTAISLATSHAAPIDLTSSGTAIFGLSNPADYGVNGHAYSHSSSTANLTDGTTADPQLFTWADTFKDSGIDPSLATTSYVSSYTGFTFAAPTTDAITSMTVNFMLIGDGGWFGTPTNPDGTGNTLTSDNVTLPTLQYTLDGTNWIDTAYTAASALDYTSQIEGQTPGYNPTLGWYPTPLVTFNLVTPVAGIEGLRLIGTSGGSSGFIAVADERVFGEVVPAPEPSTWAMLILGMSALAFSIRRRQRSLNF